MRGVPDSWRDATVYYAETDLPQLLYQGYRQGLADEKFCMGYFNVWGLDTASRSARPIRSVIAMAAGVTAEGHPAYLFDTDGDDDLSDETVRYFGADSVAVEVTPVYVERYGGGASSCLIWPMSIRLAGTPTCCCIAAECCSGEAAVPGGRYAVTVNPMSGTTTPIRRRSFFRMAIRRCGTVWANSCGWAELLPHRQPAARRPRT